MFLKLIENRVHFNIVAGADSLTRLKLQLPSSTPIDTDRQRSTPVPFFLAHLSVGRLCW
jgi:hypothetical protein